MDAPLSEDAARRELRDRCKICGRKVTVEDGRRLCDEHRAMRDRAHSPEWCSQLKEEPSGHTRAQLQAEARRAQLQAEGKTPEELVAEKHKRLLEAIYSIPKRPAAQPPSPPPPSPEELQVRLERASNRRQPDPELAARLEEALTAGNHPKFDGLLGPLPSWLPIRQAEDFNSARFALLAKFGPEATREFIAAVRSNRVVGICVPPADAVPAVETLIEIADIVEEGPSYLRKLRLQVNQALRHWRDWEARRFARKVAWETWEKNPGLEKDEILNLLIDRLGDDPRFHEYEDRTLWGWVRHLDPKAR